MQPRTSRRFARPEGISRRFARPEGIDDAQRRARLGVRHALAPDHHVADTAAVAEAMVALHATEAATVHLAVRARSGASVADVEAALYDERSVVKQLAMRRTLFGFPPDLLPAVWGSAAARTADGEYKTNVKRLVDSGVTDDPAAWLAEAERTVLELMARTDGITAARVRAEIPHLAGTVSMSPGTKWGGDVPIAPRILTWLGARGLIVRGTNAGHWRLNKPYWVPTDAWLRAAAPPHMTSDQGYDELIRRWLYAFGPGTETDLKWWLGSTLGVVRASLHRLDARPVTLDDGATGWVLPDDLDPVPEPEPWAALLPVLDPTIMGWKQRGFYVGDLESQLFDTAGNAGTSAWWCGEVVGCWIQDADGVVLLHYARNPGRAAKAALTAEARRLTEWLDGVRVSPIYVSPMMKQAREAFGVS